MKKALYLGTVFAVIFAAILTVPTLAAPFPGQETCPNGGDWVKIDGLSGTSYTYTAPAGYLITGWCYKAATTVVTGDVDPPASSVTVTSTVLNQNGQVQELSHASFLLTQEEPETCEETEAIYGTWSDWYIDPDNDSQLRKDKTVNFVDVNDGSDCGSTVEYAYMSRPKCQWNQDLYADDPACTPPPGTKVYCLPDGSEITIPEDQEPPEGAQEGPCQPPPPELVPYCTPEGVTIWLPIDQKPPDGSTVGVCEPPVPPEKPKKERWIAKCDICRAVATLWENIFGDGPEWYDNQLYGDQEERPMAASIVENCINRKSRCDYERWIVVTGRDGQPSDFDALFDGVNFPAPQPHLGADGQQWILYMNRVGPPENRYTTVMGERIPFQNSWDGWFVTSGGETLKTWRNWPCCLAASYAMTIQENGVNYAIKFPGMCQWSWVQFFVKIGYYPNPGKDNWDGWQYLFDQNVNWYNQLMDPRVPIGEKFAFPDPITEIPH